jgi:hypothetical protein
MGASPVHGRSVREPRSGSSATATGPATPGHPGRRQPLGPRDGGGDRDAAP